MSRIAIAGSDAEIERCGRLLAQLREHASGPRFLELYRRLSEGGYRLTFLEEEGQVRCVAGFRILEMLSRGSFLYVDDLVTDERARAHRFYFRHGLRIVGFHFAVPLSQGSGPGA